ncbi:hypothetical protein ACJJTC_019103 [Scirpophaga incertulas]
MTSVVEKLNKLREERMAREKARIEKLRELNLKKYNKNENIQQKNLSSNASTAKRTMMRNGAITKNVVIKQSDKSDSVPSNNGTNQIKTQTEVPNSQKSNLSKSSSAPPTRNIKKVSTLSTKTDMPKKNNLDPNFKKANVISNTKYNKPQLLSNFTTTTNDTGKLRKETANILRDSLKPTRPRFSLATNHSSKNSINNPLPRKSILHKPSIGTGESVFDRLYKPKQVPVVPEHNVKKLQQDPNFLKNVIKNTGLILNKRHTLYDIKTKAEPVRRSISAVHLKKISKNELSNCIHKWASIGEKLNEVKLNEINEDDSVKQDEIIFAVKSERKRVKFQTPMALGLNTPKPEELQDRLKNWLQKRGKSLDSYHHLQCFGIHHFSKTNKSVEPLKFELFDDEDKENIALEHDSDNESYTENMNSNYEILNENKNRWRRASYMSENDFTDTPSSTITPSDTVQQVDEVLIGAFNDLTQLLREGFEWEQCARWLRAIRERFPHALDTAAYWECRAALEETRGDLPASVQCWEEAIAKGTERSVVESNLDQLLDKFMQLKISPNSGKRKPVEDKMVDVKNVFKSTIIRFAVQQAKLRRSNPFEAPKYTVTPVRRSSRLSCQWSAKRPLQECMSVQQAKLLAPVEFVPNPSLCRTP